MSFLNNNGAVLINDELAVSLLIETLLPNAVERQTKVINIHTYYHIHTVFSKKSMARR